MKLLVDVPDYLYTAIAADFKSVDQDSLTYYNLLGMIASGTVVSTSDAYDGEMDLNRAVKVLRKISDWMEACEDNCEYPINLSTQEIIKACGLVSRYLHTHVGCPLDEPHVRNQQVNETNRSSGRKLIVEEIDFEKEIEHFGKMISNPTFRKMFDRVTEFSSENR